MPTYVYECKTCEKVFEVQQRMVENALTECNCERMQPVRRLIQPVAIAFKGEGFHINDYAPKSAEPAKTESAPETTKAEVTSAETKSETPTTPESPATAPSAAQTPPPAPAGT